MRWGVIVCPQCKQVKGIELSSKTIKCIRCGKILVLKKLKVFNETDSQEKLRQVIGLLNAEMEKNSGSYKNFLYDKNATK